MSLEIQTSEKETAEISAIVEQKRQQWATFGELIYRREMALQAQAQNQIQKIQLPVSIAQIPAAEKQLTELKQAQAAIKEQRMEITRRTDAVNSRLMLPEQSLEAPKAELSATILTLKQEHERLEKLKRLKEEEQKTLKEQIKNYLVQVDTHYRSTITKKCAAAYEHALVKADINPLLIEDFITNKALPMLTVSTFMAEKPQLFPKHHLPEEMDLIWEECWLCNPYAYVSIWEKDLREKFSDYEVAYQNKVQALEFSKKEAELAQAKLETEKQNQVIANKLEATRSSFMQTGPTIKPTKKYYEVEMEENMQNAIKIWSAFTANIELCMPKLRGKKAFSTTPTQIAAALAAVKYDDNQFQPTGIIFKEVEKL